MGGGVCGSLDNLYLDVLGRGGGIGRLPGIGVWVWIERDAGLGMEWREVGRVVCPALPVFWIVVAVPKVGGVLRVLGNVAVLGSWCCRGSAFDCATASAPLQTLGGNGRVNIPTSEKKAAARAASWYGLIVDKCREWDGPTTVSFMLLIPAASCHCQFQFRC